MYAKYMTSAQQYEYSTDTGMYALVAHLQIHLFRMQIHRIHARVRHPRVRELTEEHDDNDGYTAEDEAAEGCLWVYVNSTRMPALEPGTDEE